MVALNPNSEVKYEYINRIPGNAFNLPADSAYITFDNAKRLIYRKEDGKPRNILELNGYDSGLENEYWFKFQYNITNEDYDNAIIIE